MSLWIAGSWIIGVLVLVDMYRRPETAWAAADRERGWWAGLLGVLCLAALGVVALLIYVLALLPLLTRSDGVEERFRKRR